METSTRGCPVQFDDLLRHGREEQPIVPSSCLSWLYDCLRSRLEWDYLLGGSECISITAACMGHRGAIGYNYY